MKHFVDWINKVWAHNRDTVGDFGIRSLIHIPIGIIMSIPIFSWGLVYLFRFYERNEDAHTEDQAWKDVFGAMVGYVIGIIIQGILIWRYIL